MNNRNLWSSIESPYAVPFLLLSECRVERLAAFGGQTVLDLVAHSAETAEGSQEIAIVVRGGRALGKVVVAGRGHAGRRQLAVGVNDGKVAGDGGVQGREGLRFAGCTIGGRRGRNLLDACGCGLHGRRVLDDVGVDIVDTLVVATANCVDLGVEIAVVACIVSFLSVNLG